MISIVFPEALVQTPVLMPMVRHSFRTSSRSVNKVENELELWENALLCKSALEIHIAGAF